MGAAGFPVADLGDTVNQSLRFSGSKLTGATVSTSTWTCSFWIKFAVGDGSGYIFSAGNDAGVTTNGNQLYMNNDADSVRGRLSFDNGIEMANRELRDPNAWYHIVGNYNGSVLNYWVNNESLDTLSISSDGLISDIHASSNYRANLIKEMAKRALKEIIT